MKSIKFAPFVEATIPLLQITPKTRDNYLGSLRRNIYPTLATSSIDEISKNEIVGLLEKLPPHTHYQTLMAIKTVYREAIYRGLVSESPSTGIRTPRVSSRPTPFLTWERLQQIDFGYQTERIRFLALHGLRWGEAAALTHEDIYDGIVHVTKSVHGPTKSRAGIREVPYLSNFQAFPRYQKSVAKALEPHGVTIHSLRKTYAYMLKSAQVHVTTAAKLLGHSNPLITMRIYTAVLDNETAQAGVSLREYIHQSKNF
jgi:integrase